MVCGPHMNGFQRAFSQIRPPSPFDFPWNRLDNIVCGWDCELDPGIRLRCKRFALINFEDGHDEDTLRRLLSAPAGMHPQRLLSAAMERSGKPIGGVQTDAAAGGAPSELGSTSGRTFSAPVLSQESYVIAM